MTRFTSESESGLFDVDCGSWADIIMGLGYESEAYDSGLRQNSDKSTSPMLAVLTFLCTGTHDSEAVTVERVEFCAARLLLRRAAGVRSMPRCSSLGHWHCLAVPG